VAQLGLIPADTPAIGVGAAAGSLIRTLLLAAVLLLLWISFRPFADLTLPPEVTEAGDVVNQIGYSLEFVVLAGWCLVHEPGRLLPLVRPAFVVMLIWLILSVITSWDPSLSARRLIFTLLIMSVGGMILLLPKNVRHFGDVTAAVVLVVLAVCYLGVFLVPSLAIHQPADFGEPELSGDWRGVFGHKNEASAAMVLFIFIGLFVARMRRVALGLLIVALALTFLVFTHSKTSMVMLPLTLVVSILLARIRRPAVGIALTLAVAVVLNLFSVGSIYVEPIRNLVSSILADPSFTGRTDIWQFAIERLVQHPITGYGFSAFWSTPEVFYGMKEGWANTVSHAHNGYLDLALTIGFPGVALAVLWLVILPLVDFYRSPHDPSSAPLEMLFLRVCLFAALGSCFESRLLQEGAAGLFLFTAVFGLRLLSVSRATA
jgi:O-antigen ligase